MTTYNNIGFPKNLASDEYFYNTPPEMFMCFYLVLIPDNPGQGEWRYNDWPRSILRLYFCGCSIEIEKV